MRVFKKLVLVIGLIATFVLFSGYCFYQPKLVFAQTDHQSTGTITASASQVEVGESFKITVQGSDSDGLWGVGYLFNNTPVWEKGAASKTWTLSETTPGSYTFYGMVAGRQLLTNQLGLARNQ